MWGVQAGQQATSCSTRVLVTRKELGSCQGCATAGRASDEGAVQASLCWWHVKSARCQRLPCRMCPAPNPPPGCRSSLGWCGSASGPPPSRAAATWWSGQPTARPSCSPVRDTATPPPAHTRRAAPGPAPAPACLSPAAGMQAGRLLRASPALCSRGHATCSPLRAATPTALPLTEHQAAAPVPGSTSHVG